MFVSQRGAWPACSPAAIAAAAAKHGLMRTSNRPVSSCALIAAPRRLLQNPGYRHRRVGWLYVQGRRAETCAECFDTVGDCAECAGGGYVGVGV